MFAGWLWLLPVSRASLTPRSPEKQKAVKRCGSAPLPRGLTQLAHFQHCYPASRKKRALIPQCPHALRYGILEGHRLHLCVDENSEPSCIIELAGCEVIAAEGADYK